MNTFRNIASLLALLVAATGIAQADDSNFGIGVKAGTLGIGLDFELFDKAGLNFDLGVLWQDEPLVTLAASGTLASDPFFQASLAAEQQELTDDLSDFKAYPVISLAFIYNF